MHTPQIDISDNKAVTEALRQEDIYQAETAFEMVYKHYYAGLCGYAGRFVTIAAAEEIAQNALIWLWENRTTLCPELSLKYLLFTIVKNKAIDNIRHTQLRSKVHQTMLEKAGNKYDDPNDYLGDELYELFRRALDNLPEQYRIYFEKSRMEGMTHAEIARELGVSPQTVNYHITQAMKCLKKDLKDYLPLLLLLFCQK